jgi:hypothetical protein
MLDLYYSIFASCFRSLLVGFSSSAICLRVLPFSAFAAVQFNHLKSFVMIYKQKLCLGR